LASSPQPNEILTLSLCLPYGWPDTLEPVVDMRNTNLERSGVHEPEISTRAKLEIIVVYTSVKATLAALRTAGSLAQGLGAGIHLIVPQVVPFPAPLDQPPAAKSFTERRFRTIADASPVATRVDILLCRDWKDTLLRTLRPRSVVVLAGGRRRWWPSRERRLARELEMRGHQVVLAEDQSA
jgi:hypothetical protein